MLLKKDMKQVLYEAKKKYLKEKEETSIYNNTSWCQVMGAIDEIFSIDLDQIDEDGYDCYFAGRMNAIETIKEEMKNMRAKRYYGD